MRRGVVMKFIRVIVLKNYFVLLLLCSFAYSQDLVEVSYEKGMGYATQGHFNSAKQEFKKCIKEMPFYWPARSGLIIIEDLKNYKIQKETAVFLFKGISNSNNHQYDKAIINFNKAIEINPRYANAYNDRGATYIKKGHNDLAIKDFNKAIEINPKHDNAYVNRGSAYDNEGEYDLAISDYNKSLELNPRNAGGFFNRGLAYAFKKKYDLAIIDFDKTIELDSRHAKAYYSRGLAYAYKGKYSLSINDFNKAIEVDPEYTDAYYNRGLTYNLKGQHNLAISDLNRAIELNPRYTAAYLNRGVIYLNELGNVIKGCADFQKACDLGDCRSYNLIKQKGYCS